MKNKPIKLEYHRIMQKEMPCGTAIYSSLCLSIPKKHVVVIVLALLFFTSCTSSVSPKHLLSKPVALAHLTEFRLPTSDAGPQGITAGPDGNLWFTVFGGNAIGRITLSGAITTFPLPTPDSEPDGIAVGPDGNLWFTESNRIGRITPRGTLTEFPPLPTPNSDPARITAGSDGNLWFTENGSDKIGRITPKGTLTEFPLPTPDDAPWGIVTGPDGNLWFTESGSDILASRHVIRPSQIGRITPSGSITVFPLPYGSNRELDGLATPSGITAGLDGNLWFTESWDNKIGRITPKGTLTEFPLPTFKDDPLDRLAFPLAITVGPDGNFWFTDQNSLRIGRITLRGTCTEFALPPIYSGLGGITADPDGNLWFVGTGDKSSMTGEGPDWIGRIAVGK